MHSPRHVQVSFELQEATEKVEALEAGAASADFWKQSHAAATAECRKLREDWADARNKLCESTLAAVGLRQAKEKLERELASLRRQIEVLGGGRRDAA